MKNLGKKESAPISRRQLVATGLAVGSAALLPASNANAATKVSKTAVHFTETAANGHNCGACNNFMAPSSCRFVDGAVSHECSCWIWINKVG
jgi:hypothetical protein